MGSGNPCVVAWFVAFTFTLPVTALPVRLHNPSAMLEWLRNANVDEYSGDPIADAFASGRHSEYRIGTVDEYDGHPVRVTKYWRDTDEGTGWVVEINVPNGPSGRKVTKCFSDQFTAEAVFEKLERDYELEEWEPEEDDE